MEHMRMGIRLPTSRVAYRAPLLLAKLRRSKDLGKPYLNNIRVPLSCETFARTMNGSLGTLPCPNRIGG